jgi:hypothetical protein
MRGVQVSLQESISDELLYPRQFVEYVQKVIKEVDQALS